MRKSDKEWYLKCKAEPDRYEIIFDGLATMVLDKRTDEKLYKFAHNGKDFVLDVLSLYSVDFYLM